MTENTYTWQRITDLPDDWKNLTTDRLKHLAQTWLEQKDKLNPKAIQELTTRLQRQWAIETGLIENLYTLDRGITQTLIERGLDAVDIPHGSSNKPAQHVKRLIKDQQNVVEGLFDFVKGQRPLSTSYIKEVHAALTCSQDTTEARDSLGRLVNVPLLRGEWKKQPNNPTRPDCDAVHEYCPPEHVASEMDQLIKWHLEHVSKGIPPEVEAAWLHHRFTQIHPFQDGNGRVARALGTLVFLKSGWFPLVVLNDERTEYITALEQADVGDLSGLVKFFASLGESAFLKALALSEQVVANQRNKESVLAAIQQTLRRHSAYTAETASAAITLANTLHAKAHEHFIETCNSLRNLDSQGHSLSFDVYKSSEDTKHFFRTQIYTIGTFFEYYVNLEKYHSWVRLKLQNARNCSIVISIHSVDRHFSGVMAANVFMEYRDQPDEGYAQIDGPHILCKTPFTFTGKDSAEQIIPPFQDWLQESVLQGLIQWQQKL